MINLFDKVMFVHAVSQMADGFTLHQMLEPTVYIWICFQHLQMLLFLCDVFFLTDPLDVNWLFHVEELVKLHFFVFVRVLG